MVGELDISEVYVPVGQCLTMAVGKPPETVIRKACEHGFDDLPVVDEDGHVLGFIAVSYATHLLENQELISLGDPQLKASFVPSVCALDALLERLSAHRIVGVVDTSGADLGIVTISDLNRHSFRAILYPLFARLEEQLSRLVQDHFDDPWEWIGKLGGDKVGLVGHWECLKRDGLDVGPTVGATLTQLLTVVEKTPEISERIFSSKNQLKDFKGRSVTFRNAVMHPARPLVLNSENVNSLRRFVDQVGRVTEKLSKSPDSHLNMMPM